MRLDDCQEKAMVEEQARHLRLARIISRLILALSAFMLVDSLLNPFPGDRYMWFNQLSAGVGAGLLATALLAVGMLQTGRLLAGRLLVVLFGVVLVGTMGLVVGSGTGVDVVGATALICAPALIFSAEERVPLAISLTLGIATVVFVQGWYWAGNAPLVEIEHGLVATVRSGVVAVAVVVGLFIIYLHYSAERAKRDLAGEKARSDALLLNILPAAIAERLKHNEEVIADGFDEVTVLFADIVGFTRFSADRSPADVVRLLDSLFTRFDDLCVLHGVEKIKTVGDGYIAVAGLPSPRPDHVETAARLALDMQAVVAEMKRGMPELALRVGLHAGPVVAGVIGKRKFAYDLWGDTVNTASRMESASQPGRITVSEVVAERLAGRFELEPRGEIALKGKGEVPAWFLNGTELPRPEGLPASVVGLG